MSAKELLEVTVLLHFELDQLGPDSDFKLSYAAWSNELATSLWDPLKPERSKNGDEVDLSPCLLTCSWSSSGTCSSGQWSNRSAYSPHSRSTSLAGTAEPLTGHQYDLAHAVDYQFCSRLFVPTEEASFEHEVFCKMDMERYRCVKELYLGFSGGGKRDDDWRRPDWVWKDNKVKWRGEANAICEVLKEWSVPSPALNMVSC